VLDIGAGSGHLSHLLAEALPDSRVIANETAAAPAGQARAKLARFPNASVFDQPFEAFTETLDVIISWGSHHHLSHDYLAVVKRLLSPDGIFIVGDEFCPEYLTSDDRARLDRAEMVVIEGGYIFDNEADLAAYRQTKTVPDWSLRLEQGRQRALWTWYKFVGDYAAERDVWPVVISELQIARDDLITGFADEHKTSAHLLQRELRLNGFSIVDRTALGEREPALQSFVIYTCRVDAS
jgi:SAM-dependent methyltransferase